MSESRLNRASLPVQVFLPGSMFPDLPFPVSSKGSRRDAALSGVVINGSTTGSRPMDLAFPELFECKRVVMLETDIVIFLVRRVLRLVEIPSHLSLLPPIHQMHLRQSLAIFLRRRPAQVLLDLVRSHETESRVRDEAAADEQTRARREVAVGFPERHGFGLAWWIA
jgi:hypothetical protein